VGGKENKGKGWEGRRRKGRGGREEGKREGVGGEEEKGKGWEEQYIQDNVSIAKYVSCEVSFNTTHTACAAVVRL